ncbi:MAG: serine/threonine protein kinase [Anaerolineae bacterium]|nr:serine/threonine protein kinase [Anaerolineae bacterium]
MPELAGTIVNGYELHEKIGQGGQGTVYRAYDRDKDRIVAIKVIHPELMKDAAAIKRFQAEATIAFFLRHPCVVSLYDYWRDERGMWMVMRWFAGGSLRDQTRAAPLSLERTARVLHRVCDALAAAHLIKVVHRDLKPDNILFDEDGQAYLTDFGAAKRMEIPALTQAGMLVGSPSYFSPEHIQEGPMTPATDIYALGIVLYETLAGKHPFSGISTLEMLVAQLRDPLPDIGRIRPDLPPAINEVIQRATEKAPADRYENVRDLAAAFYEAAGV